MCNFQTEIQTALKKHTKVFGMYESASKGCLSISIAQAASFLKLKFSNAYVCVNTLWAKSGSLQFSATPFHYRPPQICRRLAGWLMAGQRCQWLVSQIEFSMHANANFSF